MANTSQPLAVRVPTSELRQQQQHVLHTTNETLIIHTLLLRPLRLGRHTVPLMAEVVPQNPDIRQARRIFHSDISERAQSLRRDDDAVKNLALDDRIPSRVDAGVGGQPRARLGADGGKPQSAPPCPPDCDGVWLFILFDESAELADNEADDVGGELWHDCTG